MSQIKGSKDLYPPYFVRRKDSVLVVDRKLMTGMHDAYIYSICQRRDQVLPFFFQQILVKSTGSNLTYGVTVADNK